MRSLFSIFMEIKFAALSAPMRLFSLLLFLVRFTHFAGSYHSNNKSLSNNRARCQIKYIFTHTHRHTHSAHCHVFMAHSWNTSSRIISLLCFFIRRYGKYKYFASGDRQRWKRESKSGREQKNGEKKYIHTHNFLWCRFWCSCDTSKAFDSDDDDIHNFTRNL